jgi:hypothetical protein
MGIKLSNNAFGTLASGINSSATSITLTTGQGARFPTLGAGDYFYATLVDTSNNLEIVKCTARSTDVLTVTRAQENTTARAYSTGDRIEIRLTAQTFLDAAAPYPSQTGNSGKFLKTDGTNVSWDVVTPAAVSNQTNTSTGAFDLPSGTTAQRPGSPTTGYMRTNTDTGSVEYYNGTAWKTIKNTDTDIYWANVLFYARGGALTDYAARHTISSVGASTAVTPGKPFAAAESTAWYLLNTTSSASNYLEIANNLSDFDPGQNTNLTIEFWLYKTGSGTGYGHFYNIGGQDNQGVIKFSTDNSYGLYWYGGSEQINFGGANTFPANTWTWFVFEKQGSTLTTWRNGVRQSQNTNAFPSGAPSFMRLGYPFGSEYANHYFDELRVTNVARYGGVANIAMQTASWPTQG